MNLKLAKGLKVPSRRKLRLNICGVIVWILTCVDIGIF